MIRPDGAGFPFPALASPVVVSDLSQPEASQPGLARHPHRSRQGPDPLEDLTMIGRQSSIEQLTGPPVEAACDDRSCMHIQSDARTLTLLGPSPALISSNPVRKDGSLLFTSALSHVNTDRFSSWDMQIPMTRTGVQLRRRRAHDRTSTCCAPSSPYFGPVPSRRQHTCSGCRSPQ